MTPTSLSSGDLVADRRFAVAAALTEAGDHVAAAEVIEQALELAPDWAAGWFALGAARDRAGDRDGAADAFARAAALDPADRLGAGLKRARLLGEAPAAPPAAYVASLFDAYADGFEAALVGRLGYRAPELIADALDRVAPGQRFARAVDLGCGTGLMAARLGARVDRLEGVDLSARMAALAEAKGLYARVTVGDVVADLDARQPASLDLAVAADVFCYLGDLSGVLAAAARALRPGGLLAFTVEQADAEDAAFVLRDSLRYAHGAAALAALAAAHGFDVAHLASETLRLDRGAPIGGLVVVLTKA